jgi:hypothetical protein
MPATTTLKPSHQRASRSAAKPNPAVVKPSKPTKWGQEMLAKMEAFRKALAAQR